MKPPQIISITQPRVINQNTGLPFTAEEFIAYQARISNPSNQHNTETSDKLLAFLVRESHWSPFDMVDIAFEVTTSRAIAAQILRHWSMRFQEFSQRYSEVSSIDYEHVEIRKKAVGGNRQGSGEEDDNLSEWAKTRCDMAWFHYRNMIDDGASPETARSILPLATLTTIYVKGSVRSWMTYFWQRCDKHAQKEHRELALQMLELFCQEFPMIGELVKTHKPCVEKKDWL
jgi:thymidylate synthase (FAD)